MTKTITLNEEQLKLLKDILEKTEDGKELLDIVNEESMTIEEAKEYVFDYLGFSSPFYPEEHTNKAIDLWQIIDERYISGEEDHLKLIEFVKQSNLAK